MDWSLIRVIKTSENPHYQLKTNCNTTTDIVIERNDNTETNTSIRVYIISGVDASKQAKPNIKQYRTSC